MKFKFKKIYIGCDPQAYSAKSMLFEFFRNHDEILVVDLGVFDIEERVLPEVLAREVGEKVIQNPDSAGILLSYSNESSKMYTAVSKMDGIRPVLACAISDLPSPDGLKLGDVNLLCIPCENNNIEPLRELVFAMIKAYE